MCVWKILIKQAHEVNFRFISEEFPDVFIIPCNRYLINHIWKTLFGRQKMKTMPKSDRHALHYAYYNKFNNSSLILKNPLITVARHTTNFN